MLVISRRRRERIVLFDADGKRLGYVTAEHNSERPAYVRIGFELLPDIKIVREEMLEIDAPRDADYTSSSSRGRKP